MWKVYFSLLSPTTFPCSQAMQSIMATSPGTNLPLSHTASAALRSLPCTSTTSLSLLWLSRLSFSSFFVQCVYYDVHLCDFIFLFKPCAPTRCDTHLFFCLLNTKTIQAFFFLSFFHFYNLLSSCFWVFSVAMMTHCTATVFKDLYTMYDQLLL